MQMPLEDRKLWNLAHITRSLQHYHGTGWVIKRKTRVALNTVMQKTIICNPLHDIRVRKCHLDTLANGDVGFSKGPTGFVLVAIAVQTVELGLSLNWQWFYVEFVPFSWIEKDLEVTRMKTMMTLQWLRQWAPAASNGTSDPSKHILYEYFQLC